MSDLIEDKLLELHKRVLKARMAGKDERKELLFDTADEVIHAILDNQGTDEEDLLILAERKDISTEVLRRFGNDPRVVGSRVIKRALIINPKTPASVSLKFLGEMFTFDVMNVLLVPSVPREVKTAAEEMLFRKLSSLSLGEKLTLARRTNSERILSSLLDDGSREVVGAVLTNAFLREGAICSALRKPTVKTHTVEQVALNPKWSTRYDVRYALLRTKHLTLGLALNFIQALTPKDLRDLAADPSVSPQIRSYIRSNLSKPGNQRNPK